MFRAVGIAHREGPVEGVADDQQPLPGQVHGRNVDPVEGIIPGGQDMEAAFGVGQQGVVLPAAKLGDEDPVDLHPVGQLDGPDIGPAFGLFQVEEPSGGVGDEEPFVVLLAGGGVAGDDPGREGEALFAEHPGEGAAFIGHHAVGGAVDKGDAVAVDAENVGRALQIDPARHRFEHRVDLRTGGIHFARRAAEHEGFGLCHPRGYGGAADGVRKAVVGNQLAVVEEGQQAVELPFGEGASRGVTVFDAAVAGLKRDKLTAHGAVERKRGARFGADQKIAGPGQDPGQQNGGGEKEEYFAESYHGVVEMVGVSPVLRF